MRALVVGICALLFLTAASASGAGRSPRLVIADREPLTIRGTRFAPNEKVKLLVSAHTQLTRSVRVGERGGFTTRFRVALGRCDALVVQAVGARGSRAQVDVTQTACAPAP
jgi:hypothetical protein